MPRPSIALPSPLLHALDRQADRLLQPRQGPRFDFSQPLGEAALVPADSVSWRIFKNPIAVFIGGVAAVILELAEPAVRAGVWTHSSFKTDPVRRLQRTGLAAMITVYGASSDARAMIARVVRLHDHVTGTTEHGLPYRANDVDLLNWVQATATWGFAAAYSRLVQPLDDATLAQAYAEATTSARLFGATDVPADPAQMRSLFERMSPRLEASPVIHEFLRIMRVAPILPRPLRPLQRLLIGAAVELVEPGLRERLGLSRAGLNRPQRWLVQQVARAADRSLLPSSPAVQSCLRLGLSADHLHAFR